MDWTNNKSIRLSKVCVCIFAAILLVMDILAYRWIPWFVNARLMNPFTVIYFAVSTGFASLAAWLCLWLLWQLLRNLGAATVFTAENIRLLRGVSHCCAAAALICLISALYYLPLLIAAIAAAFMMLIVRIVANIFRHACEMQSELDLTI